MAKKKSKSGRPQAAKKKTAKKTTAHAAKKTKKITKQQPAKKAAKKAVKKAAKKVVKKGVKKPVKKVVKKIVKKTPRKVVRQAPRRSVRQAAPPPRTVKPQPMPPPPPPPPPVLPPPAPVGEFGAVVDVVATGPAGGPNVGDVAPDFELRDEAGRVHTLAQYRGQKVVLYFYPQDDTPGCTIEACAFRDAADTFRDRNTVVLGVSPDSAESHQRFNQKYGLTFPLLVDEGHKTAQRYGVWVAKGSGASTTMGLARTTFLIDASGYVVHVFRDVKPEGHPQEVLERVPF